MDMNLLVGTWMINSESNDPEAGIWINQGNYLPKKDITIRFTATGEMSYTSTLGPYPFIVMTYQVIGNQLIARMPALAHERMIQLEFLPDDRLKLTEHLKSGVSELYLRRFFH